MNKWKEIQKSIKTAKDETKKSGDQNDAVSPRKSRLNKHACMESQRLNRIHDLQSRFSHLLDQEKCKFSTVERLPWYILNPSSMTRIGWDFMLILFLVYIAIVTPYRIGFDTSSDDIATVVFESLMDVFFLIDITLNFFTAVPVGESLKEGLVVDLKSIAKRYVSGYFLIDIFSSIPFDLINALSGNSETSSVGQIDSAKTVKTSKISKFIRLAKFTKLARLARGVKIFKRLFDFAALISHGYFVFARILISTFFIVHLNACAFGYITTNDDTAYQRTWMDDWDPTLKTSPAWRTYLSCLSFSFSIMISGEGGGIQNAQGNDLEMMIVLLFAVTSGVYYMYVAATITALLTAADMKNTLYREKMDALLHYMKTRRFPKDLYLKVLRYFKFFYSEHAIAEEEDILASMNTSLRTQVTSFLSHGIFTNTHLFADFKEDIYGMLLPLLKTMHIHMHDTIFL
jgi:potassium channel